ncbi:MAG TPA: hypothetical protein VGX71_10430 [Pseudaminobacter sp.]|nr:hypothetical protein [Pseudaminobacter sp.]
MRSSNQNEKIRRPGEGTAAYHGLSRQEQDLSIDAGIFQALPVLAAQKLIPLLLNSRMTGATPPTAAGSPSAPPKT